MKFSLFFIFLFIVLLVGTVSAQPTFTVIQIIDSGLEISFPKFDSIPQSQNFDFHAHVLNTSDGVHMDDTTTSCLFHLYGDKGRHIFKDEDIGYNGKDFEAEIDAGNFSRLGRYTYIIECNTSSLGGAVSVGFDVTANGFAHQTFPPQFSITVFAFLLVAFGMTEERRRLFKYAGSILLMVMGVLTLYPGYGFINWTTLTGKAIGVTLVGLGFYFLIEDSFSRDKQEEGYQSQNKEVIK